MLVIVRLFSLWHIARYEGGVMQYTLYRGYKTLSAAKAVATRKGLQIDEIRG